MNDKQFFRISHRGFGMKAKLRYSLSEKHVFTHNQLTGLEIGRERGANVLELDLNKTKDGHIITAHGVPFIGSLSQSKEEYLSQHPEALTLTELIEWLYHTPDIKLYLELKTKISILEITDSITAYAVKIGTDNAQSITDDMYDRIMLYTNSKERALTLIKEKHDQGILTDQLKLFVVLNRILSRRIINELSVLGTSNCRLYGVEQGAFILAHSIILKTLMTPLASIPPLVYIRDYYNKLPSLIEYAHKKNLSFIFGTVDDRYWIRQLMNAGVDGIVPNDPGVFVDLDDNNTSHNKILSRHIPYSLKLRTDCMKAL